MGKGKNKSRDMGKGTDTGKVKGKDMCKGSAKGIAAAKGTATANGTDKAADSSQSAPSWPIVACDTLGCEIKEHWKEMLNKKHVTEIDGETFDSYVRACRKLSEFLFFNRICTKSCGIPFRQFFPVRFALDYVSQTLSWFAFPGFCAFRVL